MAFDIWPPVERDAGSQMDAVFMRKWRDRLLANTLMPVPMWTRVMDFDLFGFPFEAWNNTPLTADPLRANSFFPIWIPPWARSLVVNSTTSFVQTPDFLPPFAYHIRMRVGTTFSSSILISSNSPQTLIPFSLEVGVTTQQELVTDYEWQVMRSGFKVLKCFIGESTYAHPSGDGSTVAHWTREG